MQDTAGEAGTSSCKMVQKQSKAFHTFLWYFFPSLNQNFIAYCSSKVSSRPDCIFEIHQLWQSGFCRVYSNSCCSYWFEPEIIKIGLIRCIAIRYWIFKSLRQCQYKKVGKLIECTTYISTFIYAYMYIYVSMCVCMYVSMQTLHHGQHVTQSQF